MIPKTSTGSSQDYSHDLIVQFLAELMQSTINAKSQDAFQQALQGYCDSLRPWLLPSDSPPNPRSVFSLLEGCLFDDTNENVTVVLSPEAEAFFCAWMRRNEICSNSGLHTRHAWSN